ncbi:Ribosomal large subunit pseudouridine synthase C [Candidatus Ecksteinia adelgidicola]|nr:Ribosomal large subunit pseudouridine synthase C [Candidatus Ecksteinia adelgidicola]
MNIKNIITVKTIIISEETSGQRIDNFLFSYLKNVPKSMIYRIIRKGAVRINNRQIKVKQKLKINDLVRIPSMYLIQKRNIKILENCNQIIVLSNYILYEDKYILVLNKPSGIAVHGGSGLHYGIIEGLRTIRPNDRFLELVHRLDRDTSGVLLIAKKRSSLRLLHQQLREHKIIKDYLALVRGKWESNKKIINAPLLKVFFKDGQRIMHVNNMGKKSETHFKTVTSYRYSTLLNIRPITGRTHQIRVHSSYAGHPIAFDKKYGDSNFDKKMATTGLKRLFLHAAILRFQHPNTGQNFCIEAPIDKKLFNCLQVLKKDMIE